MVCSKHFFPASRGGARRGLHGLCSALMCLAFAAIAVLAVPAGVLIALIVGIWTLTDRLVGLLEGRGD